MGALSRGGLGASASRFANSNENYGKIPGTNIDRRDVPANQSMSESMMAGIGRIANNTSRKIS